MKVLLDTNVFLWIVSEESKLSAIARDAFTDPRNQVFLSVASAWEMVVKAQRGKLPIPKPAAQYIRDQIRKTAVEVLPILLSHSLRVEKLPMHHRDPFDRILVAQAIEEKMTFVASDRVFRAYPLEILW